jgi:hypothetical protein
MNKLSLDLPEVTLVCVSGVNISNAIYALWRSSRNINFASVKLISNKEPDIIPRGISFEQSYGTELDSIDEYNKYVIYNLWRHVETQYCLIVQADGYVLNAKSWKAEFLEYDYIGAPWPIKQDAYVDPFGNHRRVGNGGFSLRSKKLLSLPATTEIPWEVNVGDFYKHQGVGLYSEDGNVCVHNRHIYESAGCKWPSVSLALDFSVESRVAEYDGAPTFGFHKRIPSLKHKLVEAVSKAWFSVELRVLIPMIQAAGFKKAHKSKELLGKRAAKK